MDLEFSAGDLAFAAGVRDWLLEHLAGRFAPLAGRGGSQNEEFYDLRVEWERELHAGGWTGLGWPQEYGGRPATVTQRVLFEYEYARAGAPYRAGFQGANLLGPTLIAHGTSEQKQRFLPRILSGDEVWCQGFSEPGAGSDLASVATRAALDGDEWVIDGQKIWTSHAHQADWIYVLARTDPGSRRHRGLSMLLVPMRQPGIEVRPIMNLAGGAEFNEVFFTGARTGRSLVVGEPHEGWKVAMGTLEQERGIAMLGYQTQFEAEFAAALSAAHACGATADPVLRQRLTQSLVGLSVMRWDTLRMLTGLMRGRPGAETSLLKLSWPRWHQELGELEMDLLGAASQTVGDDYALNPFQRTYLLSRAETIYGGAQQIHLNIVAERLLGLPRDPRPQDKAAAAPLPRRAARLRAQRASQPLAERAPGPGWAATW